MPRLPSRLVRFAPIACCASALLAAPHRPAAAQGQSQAATTAADETGVADITVTAERRSTSLQKTPLAITAIQADDLDK